MICGKYRPARALLPPQSFLQVAEERGAIVPLGCYRFQGHLYGKPMDREASRRYAGKAVGRVALQPAG